MLFRTSACLLPQTVPYILSCRHLTHHLLALVVPVLKFPLASARALWTWCGWTCRTSCTGHRWTIRRRGYEVGSVARVTGSLARSTAHRTWFATVQTHATHGPQPVTHVTSHDDGQHGRGQGGVVVPVGVGRALHCAACAVCVVAGVALRQRAVGRCLLGGVDGLID